MEASHYENAVNIEVYANAGEEGREAFAVVSEHGPDLPKPFDVQLQQWARSDFVAVEPAPSIPEAGGVYHEPSEALQECERRVNQ